jgi:hypothetical protein
LTREFSIKLAAADRSSLTSDRNRFALGHLAGADYLTMQIDFVTLAITLAVMAVVIWTVYRYGPWRRF